MPSTHSVHIFSFQELSEKFAVANHWGNIQITSATKLLLDDRKHAKLISAEQKCFSGTTSDTFRTEVASPKTRLRNVKAHTTCLTKSKKASHMENTAIASSRPCPVGRGISRRADFSARTSCRRRSCPCRRRSMSPYAQPSKGRCRRGTVLEPGGSAARVFGASASASVAVLKSRSRSSAVPIAQVCVIAEHAFCRLRLCTAAASVSV